MRLVLCLLPSDYCLLLLPFKLLAQFLFFFAQLRREGFAEIFRLEDGADFDL